MAKKMSSLFRLNVRDFAKGVFLAVLAAVITPVLAAANTGDFNALISLDWGKIGSTALTVFIAYLLKNLLSDSNGRILGRIG